MHPRLSVRIAALATATIAAAPAAADSVADFYKGKTVSIVMGTGPGGSYDLYGRTIAEHIVRHIPGHPTVIVEHMPGAGGVIAGNHIYGTAPQDGTKMLLSHAIPLSEKLEPTGVRFESAKFNWLGAYDAIAQSLTLWHTAPANTVEDLKTADIVVGSFSKTHLTYQWASLLKDAIGAKYKIVSGYRSGNDCNLAMERGEISGWTASWENIIGTRPQWLTEKKVKMLVQFTLEREPYLKDVPTLIELAPPEQEGRRGVRHLRHAVRARAGGRAGRAGRAGGGAAQGVRRADEGPGVPRRCQEAQAQHRSAQCGTRVNALVEQARVGLARPDRAREEGDRADVE